jgi:protein Mpv17
MAKFLRSIWDFYAHQLVVKPMATQMCTAGSLFGAGDIICQTIERAQERRTQKDDQEKYVLQRLDWLRVLRMATVGAVVVGPACHYWYQFLDKYIPSKQPLQVAKKILVDEFIFGPVYLGAFFVSISTLEGMTPQQTIEKIKKEYIPTFKMDVTVWPPAQAINFFFVPAPYRVLYISCISLFWNAYLSMVQHRE